MKIKEINNKKKGFLILWVLILLVAVFLLNRYFNGKTNVNWKKYLVIGKENVFVVYDEKLSIKIPQNTYVGGDKKVEDYLKNKEYSELFQVIKNIFPEELEGYTVPKGNMTVATEFSVNIPLMKTGDKNYILTSGLNEVFLKLYYGDISNENAGTILIDVLNASGKAGYAKKVGEKIEKDLGFKFNPNTHEEESEYSYIVNNSLNPNQANELVMSMDEKYIRIKEKSNLPTPANAVIIVGKESEGLLKINFFKNGEIDKENYNKLDKKGYKNLNTSVTKEEINKAYIEYKAEDYYIAYKISKVLEIPNLLENNDVDNSINVYIK